MRFPFDRGWTTPYYCALMSEGSSSQRLPRQVNPRKFAYSGVEIEGSIDSAAMARLAEAVDSIGDLYSRLVFSIRDDGKITVTGSVQVGLVYECQRCLKPMPETHLDIGLTIGIVRNEDEAKATPGSLEPWIVEEEESDLYAMLEDEILLALPVVAYHDNDCVDARLLSSGDEISESDTKEDNPFSVLAVLKEEKPGSK